MSATGIRELLAGAILFLFFLQSFGQKIHGLIIDSETNSPVEAAHVFIAGSSQGAFTEADGTFNLTVPIGYFELVVTHIAYESLVLEMDSKDLGREMEVRIKPTVINLHDIVVVAEESRKRRRQFNAFKEAFLGTTANARKCTILNPEVLRFEEVEGHLIARAVGLLKIDNDALGYEVSFLLTHFEAKGETVSYAGKPVFREKKTDDTDLREKWKSNRVTAYEGSIYHFLNALARGISREAGYVLYHARLNGSQFDVIGPAEESHLVLPAADGTRILNLPASLKVVYTGEKDPESGRRNLGNAAPSLGHPAEKDLITSGKRDVTPEASFQVSYLYGLRAQIPMDISGRIQGASMLHEYGYWSSERIAELLPLEYFQNYTGTDSMVQRTSPVLNGFTLTNLRAEIAEINVPGPPRDGIPAILNPLFVASDLSDYLNDQDVVLGLVHEGDARAYPIKILNWHEVVNDKINDRNIIVTYCPLCGSGGAFWSTADGIPRTFGVSGLLVKSNALLYDHQTESLWSQITGEALSGPSSGARLDRLNLEFTRWKSWKERYPHTRVLSNATGFLRNYDHDVYADYRNIDDYPSILNDVDHRLPAKERVIGIEIDGWYKAYPLTRLQKGINFDSFVENELQIHYDQEADSAYVMRTDGSLLPSVSLYWFAWYAFHPDTLIY